MTISFKSVRVGHTLSDRTVLDVLVQGLNPVQVIVRQAPPRYQKVAAAALNRGVHDFFIGVDILVNSSVNLKLLEETANKSDLSIFV